MKENPWTPAQWRKFATLCEQASRQLFTTGRPIMADDCKVIGHVSRMLASDKAKAEARDAEEAR